MVGKKRYDSLSFFGYPDKIQAREEDIEILYAQMKLRLLLLMRFTINHLPISLYVFHAAAS